MGWPATAMRSRMLVRWGLVNRPVRCPLAARSASTIRAVLVLPLVPVRWTLRYFCCGAPRRSKSCEIRSSEGAILVSGHRARSRLSTSARSGLAAVVLMA